MMVSKPSRNKITQGYSASHKAVDFSGKGDPNVYACQEGKVIICKNSYDINWQQGGTNDPTPWGLTTEDYGNFIKIEHADGFSLYAHLKRNSQLVETGNIVGEGRLIAEIGNSGNSTGKHLHFEYRNKSNQNIKVEFKEESMPNMYKGLDLSNPESMKTTVDTWDDVVHKKLYVKATEYASLKESSETRIKEEVKRYTDFLEALSTKLGIAADEPKILENIAELLTKESNKVAVVETSQSKLCRLLAKLGL